MKLSDYVASFLVHQKIDHIFGVTGGGAMHLNDSFGKSKKINFIMTHGEQSACMAAEAYTRKSGKLGVCNVTTGPGGTNAITGVTGAWIDSIPQLIISGQVALKDMINQSKLRQRGVQEINITDLVKPVVKYCLTLRDEKKIKYELEKCIYLSQNGRPGPTWIDIPLDLQTKDINPKRLKSFKPKKNKIIKFNNKLIKISNLIKKSFKPVIIIGNGVHLSNSKKLIKEIIDNFNIPVLSSWNASDVISTNHNRYIGRLGLFGDRASNFTIQDSDLVLVLGCRLSQPQTGYNSSLFAPGAKFIYVDIDVAEISKFKGKNITKIISDLRLFLEQFIKFIKRFKLKDSYKKLHKGWLSHCIKLKNKYPVVLKRYKYQKKINSFYFIETLSSLLRGKDTIVTDMGTSFTCTMQTFRTKENQRLFTSSGLAPMGFGLPGSIGACFANNKRKTICISGDGGVMFNIQELQTIFHHKLPIKIFILCNKGYLTMKLMQIKNFKKFVGSTPLSGISCPNFENLAKSFKIPSTTIKNTSNFKAKIEKFLKKSGPGLCQITMGENQELIPRVQTKMRKDGTFVPTPIDDMYPYLERKEYNNNKSYLTND
jgi:acetolactate synthase-1/2/3 large subunit